MALFFTRKWWEFRPCHVYDFHPLEPQKTISFFFGLALEDCIIDDGRVVVYEFSGFHIDFVCVKV